MKVIITFIIVVNTNDQQKKNKAMKKYILRSLLVLFVTNVSFAQTTATDFTTNDCDDDLQLSNNSYDGFDNNGDSINNLSNKCKLLIVL